MQNTLDLIVAHIFEAGITHFTVSPGSRNAPIVSRMVKHGGFLLYSFPDERSAAFAAMGMAQSMHFTTGMICTSGTAVINAFPAVCEAYYQRLPLLILSADRPEELIDQWDGQTIRQNGIFGTYTRAQAHLNPKNNSPQDIYDAIFKLTKFSNWPIPGPVHLNLALPEPIYEGVDLPFNPTAAVKPIVIPHPTPNVLELETVESTVASSDKILVLVGQHVKSETLDFVLQKLQNKIPILADIVSQQHRNGLKNWDISLLKREIPENFNPELLITCGTSMLSKPLKQWLKRVKPLHIHLSLDAEIGDPFETNPQHISCFDADFLEGLNHIFEEPTDYLQQWQTFIQDRKEPVFAEPFGSEMRLVSELMMKFTENDILHLGNSMSVRYGSWCGQTKAEIYGNRGSSGIDGSLSTAVGHALANLDKKIWLVLGDVSTVYDSNGLWTDLPSNLTIIILNNGGGRIFDWIDGPNKVEGIRPYIHTPRKFNFEHLAKFYNVAYCRLKTSEIQSLFALGSGSKEAVLVEFEGYAEG